MKKLFLVLAAAFAMVACQTDINEVGVAGGEVDVTFEVGTPTRAYSDGKTATRLQYAIYDETGAELTALTKTDATIDITATVSFKLVTGNSYTAIFWADNDAAPYDVDFANKTMTVDYTGVACNNEDLDAFYAKHEFTVKGAQTETIELRRPFAQLNIGTSDYLASANAGYTPNQSYVKVTNIYNTLDFWSGAVSGETAVEFAYADIKRDETFPVAAAVDAPAYEYLAMNYLLVNEKETVDVVFGYKETSTGDAKTRTVGSVPVQRNYRTNIYGQLLTSDVDINIEIKPEYDGEHSKDFIQTTDYYIAATYEAFSSTNFYVYFGNVTESSNKLVSVDYGDGTFGVDPWHTYSAAGDYNVKLYYEKPITEIRSNAFSTKAIKSIIIPKDVTKIGYMAFGHSPLTSISFEKDSKLATIEQAAFASCENLKSILLPSSVTEIGDCVFGGCYSLESIYGGARGFSTALGVFYKWLDYVDCHVIAFPASLNIEIINYGPNHHNIGWGAFVGCKYLKQLDIIINKIYQVNFWDCEQLEYIRLGETTYIENDVIKNCPKLKEINLPLASKIGENCFINNESLTTIFLGCNELKVINKLGNNNVSLNTLSIPSGVESITDSFNSCAALENIYCKATTPPALTNSFDSIPGTAKIYVPYISLSEYKTAEGWSQYADKIVAYDFENNAVVDLSSLQIGDIFEIDGAIGVVFRVGDVVKMVSVEEGEDLPWSTESITTGAIDADNGVNNMVAIKAIEGWEDLYPAFKWCADYGNGWYLPALNEMNAIYNEKSAVNSTLSAYGFTTLATDADSSETLGARYHWSSTEYESKFAWELDFTHGYTFNYKSYSKHVRAIFAF